ncbi:MAG: TIGR00730 family Rossman fold protein [Sphingomonadales bacterium]
MRVNLVAPSNQSPDHGNTAHVFSACVFCGSRPGADPRHAATATALGEAFAAAGIRLVYGGGGVGLMGIAARALMRAGGVAVGVIPRFLEQREVAQAGLSELILVDSMHERKARMATLSQAFIALPGGTGTLDELIEITTWAQLGLHDKPIFLLGDDDYWQPLLDLITHMIDQGFAAPSAAALLRRQSSLEALMASLNALRALGQSRQAGG